MMNFKFSLFMSKLDLNVKNIRLINSMTALDLNYTIFIMLL